MPLVNEIACAKQTSLYIQLNNLTICQTNKNKMEILGITIPTTQIILAALVLVLSYLYLTWQHTYWQKRGIPGPKPYPVVGTLHNLFKMGFLGMDLEYVSKYGKIVGEYFGRRPVMMIADANIVKQIMVKDFNFFPDRSSSSRNMGKGEKYMSKMLINLEGEEWKRVRNTLTPAFSASKLKVMIEHVNHSCEVLMANFRKSKDEQLDIKKFTDAFTLDVIARVGFGVEMDSQRDPNNPFLINGRKIVDFSVSWRTPLRFLLFFMPSLFQFIRNMFPERVSVFSKEATNYFINLIRKIMKQREDGQTSGKLDLIQLMLNAHNLEEKTDEIDTEIGGTADIPVSRKGLDEEEIVAQSFILMIAGFETTSTTISFLLYNLATNPDCQEKLQREIDEVVGESDTVTYEMTHRLPYLEMCINESLRVYPPAVRTDRHCNHEVTIDGLTIPAGVDVGIGIGALHYDADVWPDPHKFDPQRFTAEAKARRDPIYFMPFSAGPRNCIGMRLAQLEIRITIVKILQTFTVKPCAKTQIPLVLDKVGGMMKAEKGIFVKLDPRH